MKSIKNLFFIMLIALAAAIIFAGCENPAGGGKGKDNSNSNDNSNGDDSGNVVETCTVTFDVAGGSPATQTLTVAKNASVGAKMPGDPAKAGCVFDGWYTAAVGGALFAAATPVTENITVYARWFTNIAIPDENDDTLADALDWLRDNATEGGAYTITVKSDETISGQSLFYDDKRVSITINGDQAGRKIKLCDEVFGIGERDSLFAIERGVKLNVENLTLEGLGSGIVHNRSLVQVNSGGVLKLKTGAVITEHYTDNNGGGVKIEENAEFIMEGGEIRGNTAREGGGVDIWKGTFTMKGGTISNNTVTENNGGGVRVGENATFIMEGGEISGNTANNDSGGGVEVRGTFTMKNGEISGNTAKGGGGVRVGENATFTMQGGTIKNNTATEWQGGGVRIESDAIFTMQGGTISNNTSTNGGGGVKIEENAIFTMERGTISNNTSNDSGGGVEVWRGSFTMKNGEISGNTAKGGGGVRVGDSATFTMQGGTIKNNTATEWSGGGVQAGEGAVFIMKGGTISGNTAANDCGGGVDIWRGTFTMKNGEISGNTAQDSGGGVFASEDTNFTMEGGTISGNTVAEWSGGGVFVNENAAFNLEGGTISGNTAQDSGGGVFVNENGTFTKKGGTIYGDNDATHTPGSAENTALSGYGHTVALADSDNGWRNATAGPGVKLYARYSGGAWTYNDIGGVGDTATNWGNQDGFVAVNFIYGNLWEAETEVEEPFTLDEGIGVDPANATDTRVIFSVKDAGSTGATITGNILTATALGEAIITGTVVNGRGPGIPFTQDWTVKVKGPLVEQGDFATRQIQGGVELALYNGNALNVVTPDGLGITVIGSRAFQFKSTTSVVVSEGVVKIEENAFLENGNLTSITLPASLEFIIRYAFDNPLASLTVLAVGPPDMSVEDWYTGDRLPTSLEHIYVPAASVDTYKNADGWRDYASIITAIIP
jgi:uncharacterized repeat protein (TIGR02543 family)